jgi:hypothetical protein
MARNKKNSTTTVEDTTNVETPEVQAPDQDQPKAKKVKTSRSYLYLGGTPANPKGQVTTVLKALAEMEKGSLAEFVAKVNDLDPNYKTKTPIEASVKFHLHLLSRKGYVQEVDTPIAQEA